MGRQPWLRKRYPSFFKILIGDFSNKLQIPAAFIKNFDGEVPRQAVLWSPARECWHVNVEKSNERLFFEEGWGLFLKENGLEFGDLLVFHYAGKSEFGVEFYGRSCCQKRVVTASSRKGSMPLNVHSENQNKMKREREQSEKRYHDNDRNNECRNKNLDDLSLKVPSDEIIASQKKVRIEVIDLETDDSEPSEQYSTEENELFEENSQTRKGRIPAFRSWPGLKSEAYEREVRALEAANNYIPKHPFFKSVMGKAYVMKKYLGIQMSFYKGSMMSTQRNGSSIILQHTGRSWPVKFCVNDKQPPRFTSGWGDFVKDNAIKLGEVCVFELIESNVMKVSIFRC